MKDSKNLNFLNKFLLIYSFRLVVSQNGRALHIVFPHQFLDSPEWFGVSTDEYFQVYTFFFNFIYKKKIENDFIMEN